MKRARSFGVATDPEDEVALVRELPDGRFADTAGGTDDEHVQAAHAPASTAASPNALPTTRSRIPAGRCDSAPNMRLPDPPE